MASYLQETSTAKNQGDFLNRVAKAANRPRHTLSKDPFVPVNNLPETTLTGKNQDGLLEPARKSSEGVYVGFHVIKSADPDHILNNFIQEKETKSLVLPSFDEEKWQDYSLGKWQDNLRVDSIYYRKPEFGRQNIVNTNNGDGAIGFVDFLSAESGTVTVTTYPQQGRMFHFLPTRYLATVPKNRILPHSRQAMDYYQKAIQDNNLQISNISFITDPPNSGDAKMVLIIGVHGPLDMEYVAVEDM